MKKLILMIIISISLYGYSQERKSITTDYKGGTLTFQYYEKDGVKIPDGPMEFVTENYIQKGENKNGYRTGLWTLQTRKKRGNTIIKCNFKEGLIDGEVTILKHKWDSKKDGFIPINEQFKFKNGHLWGENKIVNNLDTVYCNFDDKGDRVGVWKIIKGSTVYYTEYTPDDQVNGVSYTIDVLGRKSEYNPGFGPTIPFIFFSNNFNSDPESIGRRKLVVLPTLSESEYGIVKNLYFPNSDNYK